MRSWRAGRTVVPCSATAEGARGTPMPCDKESISLEAKKGVSEAPDRLMNIREAAQLMSLSPGSVYHYVSQGRIPVVRLSSRCIRFRRSDLLKWWERLTEE